MPIKIPKGFQRRKSSGNALDEVPAAEPSFRVYERPSSSGQVLDKMANQSRIQPVQRNSFEYEDEDLFTVTRPDAHNRGSGGTETSLATAQYDSGASSTRLSTSSTNPSSVETRSDKNIHAIQSRAYTDVPVPPQQSRTGGFLRNAGRTFSFGMKSQKDRSNSPPPPPLPTTKHRFSLSSNRDTGADVGRERAVTTSTVSTTTPPRLLESDLALNHTGSDGFGNMFDGIGAKSREPSPVRPLPAQVHSSSYTGDSLYPDATRGLAPRPLMLNRNEQMESSPYSWTSETSRDGLMHSPSPPKTITKNSPEPAINRSYHNASTTPHEQADSGMEDNLFSDTPSRPRAYSRPTRQTGPPPSSFIGNPRIVSPQPSSAVPSIAEHVREQDEAIIDHTLMDSATLASRYQETKSAAAKKVMTPQQFERYRQQQDERHRLNKAFGKADSDESDDDYDDVDDDEGERDRQAQKQRKKQEAHLAVYRQTMIKVTGEPASGLGPNNFGGIPATNSSSLDVSNRLSTLSLDPGSGSGSKSPAGRSSEGEEDDDIPLGILAAHGFPNKNRPPSRLLPSGSNSNLRGVAQSHGPGSVAGESINRNSLPAFARKLPEDPYYGSSLVSPPHRESMAFHSLSTPNLPTLATPSGASTNHPHHPAGLVGVIAGEERARAARRGSPNPVGGPYDMPQSMPAQPGMLRSQTMGQVPTMMMPPGMPGMPGMPMMGMPPMISAGDHAQIQMSQQMTQMMQMQMQWMQQMQHFMTGQGNPGMTTMSPIDMQSANASRPQSVPLQNYGDPTPRTMSMINPAGPSWNLQPPSFSNGRPNSSYAPSIAPSERSNIGLASRYRPVSSIQEPAGEAPWQKRASTMTSTTLRPLSTFGTPKAQPTQTVRKVAQAVDDDDDEAGWAEMKAKKEKKQRGWRLRKGTNPLQELYNGST